MYPTNQANLHRIVMYEFMLITITTGVQSKYTAHLSWSTTPPVNEHTRHANTQAHTQPYTHRHTKP